ncbi:MAG: hemerythrin domain-containing protein [Burkholderiales bacterium]
MPSRKSQPSAADAVDAIELLTDDHRRVDEMFEEYEATKDSADDDDKEQRVVAICVELTVHATVEEEIFYPAAREAVSDDDSDMLDEAEVEHATVKELVDQLSAMSPAEALYDAKVKVLSEYVKHHVQEEEEKLFPALRETDLDLEALGAEIAQRKQELQEELEEEMES